MAGDSQGTRRGGLTEEDIEYMMGQLRALRGDSQFAARQYCDAGRAGRFAQVVLSLPDSEGAAPECEYKIGRNPRTR